MSPQMVKTLATNFNGITMAYLMGFVNAALGLLIAFGLNLTELQQGAIVTFINAALIVVAHLGHRLGEITPTPMPDTQTLTRETSPPESPPIAT